MPIKIPIIVPIMKQIRNYWFVLERPFNTIKLLQPIDWWKVKSLEILDHFTF